MNKNILAMGTWRHYLHGNPFTIRILTDHNSLIWLQTQPHLSLRQTRWLEKLSEFDYKIEYQEGKKNVVADALSRRPDHRPIVAIPSESQVSFNQVNLTASSTVAPRDILHRLKASYIKDPFCQSIMNEPLKHSEYTIDSDSIIHRDGRTVIKAAPNKPGQNHLSWTESPDFKYIAFANIVFKIFRSTFNSK